MSQSLGEKYFSAIPISRCGEYTGKIKCPCHYEFWRHVEGIFRGVKNKIIIDLGCGPGLKSLTLALAGANVIAIDNSSRRLSEFKKTTVFFGFRFCGLYSLLRSHRAFE